MKSQGIPKAQRATLYSRKLHVSPASRRALDHTTRTLGKALKRLADK